MRRSTDLWRYVMSVGIKPLGSRVVIKKLEAMAIQVSEGLSNAKEGMSKKALELKEYLESTRVVKAFRQMDIQYASLRIKTRTNQLKLSLQEFKNKIKEKISGE